MINKMMKEMEARVQKRARRGQIESAIINSLAVAGILTIAAAAPNTVQLLKYVDLDQILHRDPRQRLRETAWRLKRKGLITFVQKNGNKYLKLTTAGRRLAIQIENSSYVIKKPRKWDGRWRIVIFDIPENRRYIRDKARRLVQGLGFYRLQDSVWVHPYDCEEIITILKSDLQIGKDLLYVIADAIEYDKPLRAHFNLRQ